MYIAAAWKLFGKTLMVSHLAILPFVFGTIYHIYRYIHKSGVGKPCLLLICIFVILDPTLVSQLSLVTFDIPQIFFFLWCINSLTEKRKVSLAIAFTLLCMTSLRGTICAGGIIIFSIINDVTEKERISLKKTGHSFLEYFLSLFFCRFFYPINI